MFFDIIKRWAGSSNDRLLKSLAPSIEAINAAGSAMAKLTDSELAAQTGIFRAQIAEGRKLDDILVEAYATVREAAYRSVHMRHFDVQLVGGIALHRGMIAEMRTGEGKTLVATLPAYLNALGGRSVHVVTVNDYLARRDAEWMGAIYRFLGLSVGTVVPDLSPAERQAAYRCDIVYATNNELGFDYLRDNMQFRRDSMVQRDHNFAIVDEVDSILIDEARTPLIISGPTADASDLYRKVDRLIPALRAHDYEIDEKQRAVTLSETGQEHAETLLHQAGLLSEGGLYDIQNINLLHHIDQALRAHKLFTRDKDYIVRDDRVVIIDEFTGRMMEGRRYSEGLHQALEAKEGVKINTENQTLASVTFQNYFRLYEKLAGMTGTAMTEAAELEDIYRLRVAEIPTNRLMIREDHNDEVYRTNVERDGAALAEIVAAHERGQPVLVGTISIEKSEALSRALWERKIGHNVLNARQHAREASIIADAGRAGAITIATNMAGRGTDIQLGGNVEMMLAEAGIERSDWGSAAGQEVVAAHEAERQKVLVAGGLYVLGTERHESRRIDNQLRGRSGRQGDPGASKFFVSLEDDLMRIFGSERIDSMLRRMGLEEGEAIVHSWITRALEKAQQKVEERNFEIRKQLLRYDDVMNEQRQVIFAQRQELMEAEDVSDTIREMRAEVLENLVAETIPPEQLPEQWQVERLTQECARLFGLELPIGAWAAEDGGCRSGDSGAHCGGS